MEDGIESFSSILLEYLEQKKKEASNKKEASSKKDVKEITNKHTNLPQ